MRRNFGHFLFIPCSSVSVVNFEQVNADWADKASIVKIWLEQILQRSLLNDTDKNLFFSTEES